MTQLNERPSYMLTKQETILKLLEVMQAVLTMPEDIHIFSIGIPPKGDLGSIYFGNSEHDIRLLSSEAVTLTVTDSKAEANKGTVDIAGTYVTDTGVGVDVHAIVSVAEHNRNRRHAEFVQLIEGAVAL